MSQISKSLHHFTIIVGARANAIQHIKEICADALDFVCDGNPRFFLHEFDSLSVDDSREFSETKNRKLKSGEASVSILAFSNATRESQNALLKLLEEPVVGNFIFFVVPDANILLPTITSRGVITRVGDSLENKKSDGELYASIVSKSYKERIEMVEDLIKKNKDEKIPKSAARDIVHTVIKEMHQRLLSGRTELAGPLRDITSSAQFINMPSAATKTILEHIMLTIPKSDIIKK